MHRTVLAAARTTVVAVAALSLLAGCAGATEPSSQEAGAAAAGTEGTTAYPLTLESPFGETTLKSAPERVAVVSASTVDTDATLSLGVTPVLAPSTVERNPWLEDTGVDDIEKLWESESGAEISAETVAAAEPDVIVALDSYDTFDQAQYDKLKTIAPVVYAEQGDLDYAGTTERLGEVLDRQAQAKKVVDGAHEAIEKTAADHPELDGHTAAHVIVYAEEWGVSYASAPGSETAELFESLGMKLPKNAEKFADDDVISDELVGLIDADFLLLSTFGEESDYFVDKPLVQQVPAVKEDRVVINEADEKTNINEFAWGLNQLSVLSVPWLTERLAEFASESID